MADVDCGAGRSGSNSLRTLYRSPLLYHRIILLLCAIVISFPVIYKSRPGADRSAGAAFSVQSSSRGYVRINGEVRHAGMYAIPANKMAIGAIKMAVPVSSHVNMFADINAGEYLDNGTALHVSSRPDGVLVLTKSLMSTNERIVMGVALDINSMNEADFDRIPGIGPVMAKRIVAYRQNNGGLMAAADLINVAGIGDKKYKQLMKYF